MKTYTVKVYKHEYGIGHEELPLMRRTYNDEESYLHYTQTVIQPFCMKYNPPTRMIDGEYQYRMLGDQRYHYEVEINDE